MVDYAQHLMRIESATKEAHEACLEKNWEAVRDCTNRIAAEARMLYLTSVELQSRDEEVEAQRKLSK